MPITEFMAWLLIWIENAMLFFFFCASYSVNDFLAKQFHASNIDLSSLRVNANEIIIVLMEGDACIIAERFHVNHHNNANHHTT